MPLVDRSVLEVPPIVRCIHSSRLGILLANLWAQRALIVVFLTAVFWNNLFAGVPRADQLAYLHQMGQFHDLWDIVIHSPSWNRTGTANVGDAMLFRPLLYMQLGVFYYCFGYHFMLWQIADLVLHLIVVLGVHALLAYGQLRWTPYPVLLSLLFGTSLLGSELVMWNHIAGYIMFAGFTVFSVYELVLFLNTSRLRYGLLSLFLGVLSEFTYELGVIVNVLVATMFFYRGLAARRQTSCSRVAISNITWRANITWGGLFGLSAFLYPVVSIGNLWMNNLLPQTLSHDMHEGKSVSRACLYTMRELTFWIGGWLFPTGYPIRIASGRSHVDGFNFSTALALTNIVITLFFLCALCIQARKARVTRFLDNRNNWRGAALAMLCLWAYAFIIAWYRALPRGLLFVLKTNIYYGYIACLIIVVGVGIFFLKDNGDTVNHDKEQPDTIRSRYNKLSNACILVGLVALIGLNASSVVALAHRYRYNYAPPKQQVIDGVLKWLSINGKDPAAYFVISSSCSGNEELSGFDITQIRKNSGWIPPVTFADALWPEKSFALNAKILSGQDFVVTGVLCATEEWGGSHSK